MNRQWTWKLGGAAALGLCLCGYAQAPAANLLANPGFEELAPDGSPVGWQGGGSLGTASLTEDAPRSGARAARLTGNGTAQSWRQEVQAPPTRLYTASGWFRARDVKVNAGATPEEYARFYFHILYRDRPYSDATQAWKDIPVGTHDWTRLVVRLTPQTQWPIESIRVTVCGSFSAGSLDVDDIVIEPASPWGGCTALEWTHGLEAVMLTDMSRAEPAAALATRSQHGRWRVIDYEARPHGGKLLWASGETDAPPVSLALPLKGWHAIYLGLADPSWLTCNVRVRLTGDPAFVPRSISSGAGIEEVLFRVADLDGQRLELGQANGEKPLGGGLAYVKLVPLTPAEVARVQVERANASSRRLVASIDGFSYIYERRPTTVEALLEEVEPYRDSDFGTLILQVGGADMVNYSSKIGEMRGLDLDDFARVGDRRYTESTRILAEKGINPTKVLIEGAHAVGMQVHVAVRPAAWVYTEPLGDFFGSRFYEEHPAWRCVDRDGTPVARMSLAVPEVRARLLDVLGEAVQLGADGANLLFVRGMPVVLFEPPFLALFRERHGEDALQVDENDPRILALRAEILTTFVREVRGLLDREAGRRGDGRRLAISAFTLADEADNLRFGLDVRRWMQERLVDLVLPYLHAGGGSAKAYDLAFFHTVCAPAGVPVMPTFVAWDNSAVETLLSRAVEYYDAGADGLTVWDANAAVAQADRWAVTARLGHADELRQRVPEGPPQAVTRRFSKVGDLVLDGRYSPLWGF